MIAIECVRMLGYVQCGHFNRHFQHFSTKKNFQNDSAYGLKAAAADAFDSSVLVACETQLCTVYTCHLWLRIGEISRTHFFLHYHLKKHRKINQGISLCSEVFFTVSCCSGVLLHCPKNLCQYAYLLILSYFLSVLELHR